MEDREILALLLARSERALDALRAQYGRLCRRIAMNILHSEPDAEECENDTYLAVWNTVPPAEPDPLTPYVGRIARNLALDRYRYNRAARRYAGEDAPLEELAEVVTDSETPETEAERAALAAAINRFLASLKAEERRLFVRRYWYGDRVDDIAASLGMTANTASVRLHRVRARLRDFLGKEGFDL